jgi:hypothetical protein
MLFLLTPGFRNMGGIVEPHAEDLVRIGDERQQHHILHLEGRPSPSVPARPEPARI